MTETTPKTEMTSQTIDDKKIVVQKSIVDEASKEQDALNAESGIKPDKGNTAEQTDKSEEWATEINQLASLAKQKLTETEFTDSLLHYKMYHTEGNDYETTLSVAVNHGFLGKDDLTNLIEWLKIY